MEDLKTRIQYLEKENGEIYEERAQLKQQVKDKPLFNSHRSQLFISYNKKKVIEEC